MYKIDKQIDVPNEKVIRKIAGPFTGGLSNKSFTKGKETKDDIIDVKKLFGNKKNIELINSYLKDELKTTAIILRGYVGSGKISLLKSCIKNQGYNYNIFDTDYETEDIFDNLMLSISTKNITRMFNNSKTAIILRDVDNALKDSQKKELYKFLSSGIKTKVFMTSNSSLVSVLREVPKSITQLDYEEPCMTDLIKHFSGHNISKNAFEKVVKESQYDIRYINNFFEAKGNCNKKININNIGEHKKNQELDTFKSIEFCLKKDKTLEEKLTHTSLYTNSTIFHNYPSITSDMNIISKIADLCTNAEELISYSFEYKYWTYFEDEYNSLGTIYPLLLLNSNDADSVKRHKMSYPSSNMMLINKTNNFSKDETDSVAISILMKRHFVGNKIIRPKEFKNELRSIDDPVNAYKLSCINGKKSATFLRELKKYLI